MRALITFLALMALGLLAAVVIALVATGVFDPRTASMTGSVGRRSAMGVDYSSFLMGLAAGIALTGLARVSWADLPRRAIAWLLENRKTMRRASYAAFFLALLILY